MDQNVDPLTFQCSQNTTLGDLYIEIAKACNTNPFHVTVYGSGREDIELTAIEMPMMALLQFDDVFRFRVNGPKTLTYVNNNAKIWLFLLPSLLFLSFLNHHRLSFDYLDYFVILVPFVMLSFTSLFTPTALLVRQCLIPQLLRISLSLFLDPLPHLKISLLERF